MNQQEAQQHFNEKLKTFQEETLFENSAIATMHPYYLAALRGLSVMQLKVSLEDYKESLEVKMDYSLKTAGLILHVVEKATPDQLQVRLEDYASLMSMCADTAEAWQAAVKPTVEALKKEAEELIDPAPAPEPKIKELIKKKNKKPQAEA